MRWEKNKEPFPECDECDGLGFFHLHDLDDMALRLSDEKIYDFCHTCMVKVISEEVQHLSNEMWSITYDLEEYLKNKSDT